MNRMLRNITTQVFGVISHSQTFKHFSWYTLAQIVVQGVGFLSAVIVSRYLGPTNLGLLSFVQNYLGGFLTITAGMDFYFVWKLAKIENKEEETLLYVGHKFNILLVLSLVGTVSAFFVLPKSIAYMVLILLAPSFLQSFTAFNLYSAVTNRAKRLSFFQVFSSVSLLIIKVVLVKLEAPLQAFIAVTAIDMFLSGLLLAIYYVKISFWKKTISEFYFPSLLKSFTFIFSIKTSIVALASWQLLLRVDQLALATFSDSYLLGIYSAATKIAEMPNFLAGVLSTALISKISLIASNGTRETRKNLNRMVLIFLGMGSFLAICIIIIAKLAVKIVYGDAFVQSGTVLEVYALSIPAMFMNYLFLGIYGTRDRYTFQLVNFTLALVINVGLIYVLMPKFGVIGVAFSTVIAYTASALLFYIKLYPKES